MIAEKDNSAFNLKPLFCLSLRRYLQGGSATDMINKARQRRRPGSDPDGKDSGGGGGGGGGGAEEDTPRKSTMPRQRLTIEDRNQVREIMSMAGRRKVDPGLKAPPGFKVLL